MAEWPDPEQRPTFVCRFLTCDQQIELFEVLEQARAASDNRKCAELLDKAIGLGVVAVKNLPDDWLKTLTTLEKWELANAIHNETRAAEIDRKKSGQAARSATGTAAQPAAATGATASA